MILKSAPVVNTGQLMWYAPEGRFVGEISDFGRSFEFGQIYDDAIDLGITLQSQKDQTEVQFVVENEKRDREGDILWWDLQPARLSDRSKYRFGVRIFND
jgi:hypothetical protein